MALAMKSPRLILCATDLQPGGDRAVREADAWARRHGAALTVVHVIPEASRLHVLFPQFAQKAFSDLPEHTSRVSEAVAERVSKITGRGREAFDIRVDVGSPPAVIVALAEEVDAELVVVGATGDESSIGPLGSVALRVVQHAHSPVLLVRPGPERGPVLAATDLSDSHFPAIDAGAFLSTALGEELTVLHVAEPPPTPLPSPEAAGLGLAFAFGPEDAQLLQEAARDRLNSAMTRLEAHGQCLVEQGLPAVHVVSTARRLGVRLLVIGTEGRTGLRRMLLGSTAEQILRDAPCPVMVVRLHSQGA